MIINIKSNQMKILTLAICLGFILPVVVGAQESSPPSLDRVILGRIEYLVGETWFIEKDSSARLATVGMKVFTGDKLKVSVTTWIRFLNGNQLKLSPGALVEFSPLGATVMLSGEGEIVMLSGWDMPMQEGEQSLISMWPVNFRLRKTLDGVCDNIALQDLLKLFILAMGLEADLQGSSSKISEYDFYCLINDVLRKRGHPSFPVDNYAECAKRDFYVNYFYTFLIGKFGWPETDIVSDKEAALSKQGYLNLDRNNEKCICRSEALGMLWDVFLNVEPMAVVSSNLADPYAAPFPNIYEEPISRIK